MNPHWIESVEYERMGKVIESLPNGVCQYSDGLWYWSDETYTSSFGPYKTSEEAKYAQDRYALTV